MNKIVIDVEFRQRTVAGITGCRATHAVFDSHIHDEQDIKESVQYVKKILDSEAVRDASITFICYKDNGEQDITARINQEYNGCQVVKFERWNSKDFFFYEKITSRQIKELYLECADRLERKCA